MKESDKPGLQERARELEFEVQELRAELEEKNVLLNGIYSSRTWRLGQFYGRLLGPESPAGKMFYFLLNSARRFKGGFTKTKEANKPVSITVSDFHYSKISSFIKDGSCGKGIFVVFAHPKIGTATGYRIDRMSHRAVRLAHEFASAGFGIVYIYKETRPEFVLDEIEMVDDNIIQMNIRLFLEVYKYIFDNTSSTSLSRTLLIQALHPSIVEVLGHANASNWTTVYDVIDNWEEFHKEGWLPWYCKRTEEFILNNSDVRIAVSDFLKNKFSHFGTFNIVHNGYSPHMFLDGCIKPLSRGSITAGYIGDLQGYRFDWDLLLSIAELHRDWRFYLIGKLPRRKKLPDNITSLGRVRPALLPAYAGNWDAGIIPFKVNNLTLSCDNLKVYEYLYFGLPVVATGVGEHIRDYPYVSVAENANEFERYIEDASAVKFERDRIADFLKESEWSTRAGEIIRIIEKGNPVYKEYIFEGAVHT